MKYLHENNVDTSSHAGLQAIIDNIEAATGTTYKQIEQHPWKYGNALLIENTYIQDNFLTANEISALDDTATIEDKRNSTLPEDDRGGTTRPHFTVIAKWIESIPESAFDITRGVMSTDATFESNIENKYVLHLIGEDHQPSLATIQKESQYFTMNSIEYSGSIRMNDGRKGNWSTGHDAVWWTHFDHPNNPYFGGNNKANADAIKRRALVAVLIDMIMRQERWDTDGFAYRYFGYALLRWAYVIKYAKEVIPPLVKKYIDQGLKHAIAIEKNPISHAGTQTHMDDWKYMSLYLALEAMDDSLYLYNHPEVRTAIDQVLGWGSLLGTIYQDHDGGYDNGYMGIKIHTKLGRYIKSKRPEDKQSLEDLLELQKYILLPEPHEEDITRIKRYTQYTGNNMATKPGMLGEQWGWQIKNVLIAYLTQNGQWRGWDCLFDNTHLPDESEMVPFDGTGMDATDSTVPPTPDVTQHWCRPHVIYYDELIEQGDVYTTLKNRKNGTHLYVSDEDNDKLKANFSKSTGFLKALGGRTGYASFFKYPNFGGQLWNLDLGFRDSSSNIVGFQGSVGSFWRKDSGAVILGKHIGSQDDDCPQQHILNGLWVNHMYGQLSSGEWFSTGYTTGGQELRNVGPGYLPANQPAGRDTRVFAIDEQNNSLHVEISNNLNPMRHGHDPFTNTVEKKEIHDIDSTGWAVEKRLKNIGDTPEQMTSLVEEIPVVLHSNDRGIFTLPSTDSLTVEYNSGGSFTSLSNDTWIPGVQSLKLTRYNTSTYIVFDEARHPNGLPVNFLSRSRGWYQECTTGIIQIDLHPNRGTAVDIPALTTIKYKLQPTYA